MVQFANEPTVSATDKQAIVNLRVTDDSTDLVWRGLYNDLAKQEADLDTEALGDQKKTVLVVRPALGTDFQKTQVALEKAGEIAVRADNDLWDRRNVNSQVEHGAREWWQRQVRGF
jgi:hypothetical protein